MHDGVVLQRESRSTALDLVVPGCALDYSGDIDNELCHQGIGLIHEETSAAVAAATTPLKVAAS